MISTWLTVGDRFALWKSTARSCIRGKIAPGELSWDDDGSASLLFGESIRVTHEPDEKLRVSRAFLTVGSAVACHRSEERWSLLYELLWRLTAHEPRLLEIASDPLVVRLTTMQRAVRRASHKMKAFVRFQEIASAADVEYVSWFEPAHRVVEKTAPFFVERFPSMKWSILTPDACARWDGNELVLDPGIPRSEANLGKDELESLWRTYYAGTFNPARLNRGAMRAEMPVRYWKNLPEAILIRELSRDAPSRVAAMIDQTLRAPEPLPPDLDRLEGSSARLDISDHEAWDPVYDPGWREARRRAEAVAPVSPEAMSWRGSRIFTGVAGWTDPTLLLNGVFYPVDATTPESRLKYYASLFPMVEVDATFYSLPSTETCRRWVDRTPDGFVFNIKAHSLMTGHPTNPARLPKWLSDELPLRLRIASNVYAHHFSKETLDEVWRRFIGALAPLREAGKLGAVMLQYPRWFTPSRASAAALVEARERLGDCPATVEIRHMDWVSVRVRPRFFALLRDLGFSYVAVDSPPGMVSSVPRVAEVTNEELAMFRFHGRRESTWEARNDEVAERYRYLYQKDQLAMWIPSIARAAERAMRVHLTFNNNKWNYAIANALEMGEVLYGEDKSPTR